MPYRNAGSRFIVALGAVVSSGASEDEAWIEDFMASPAAVVPGAAAARHAWPPEEIEFGDLPQFVGHAVRLTTDTGRTRVGTVERADATEVVVRTRLGGGYASFTLKAAQVVKVELVQA